MKNLFILISFCIALAFTATCKNSDVVKGDPPGQVCSNTDDAILVPFIMPGVFDAFVKMLEYRPISNDVATNSKHIAKTIKPPNLNKLQPIAYSMAG